MSEPFTITTPIYYVNDVPHIGHAYTTVAADVVARWRRLWGDDVFFLTGTDEHGLKVQRSAEGAGRTPQEHADLNAARFAECWDLLQISHDDFIRTTEPRHYEAVAKFLQTVYDNGFIEKGTYQGLYCVGCEAYYTDSELTPPEPGRDGPGNCPIHGRPVELVTEENWFFLLSRFEEALLEHYRDHPSACEPESRRNEVIGFIRQGLQDFSISRTSITWGIPIPWDPKHVTYVWFDALCNYTTAVGYGTDAERFARQWPATHFVGKDILRFHAVYWPAMLMAAGLSPPKQVFAHGWLLVGGEKMSKSKLNQIFPADLVADFGVDGFRYHFMADQRFGPDGDFSYEAMVARYNADLANNYGNLTNRVLNMAENYLGGQAPPASARANSAEMRAAAAAAWAGVLASWSIHDLSDGVAAIGDLIRATNAYIEQRQPWALNKAGDLDAVAGVLGDCLEALRIVALLSSPILVNAAPELWRRLGLPGRPDDQRLDVDGGAAAWGALDAVPRATLTKGAPLFPRFEAASEAV